MSGLERWEKWDEAEIRFLATYETPALNAYIKDHLKNHHLKNHKFAIGEVVKDKFGNRGVVQKLFEMTGLYVIFPQYEVPQLVRAADMEKVNED